MVEQKQDIKAGNSEAEELTGKESSKSSIPTDQETGSKSSTWKRFLNTWIQYFRTHRNQVIFAAVGLVVALGFLVIGFWATLLLVVFVYAGILYGRYRDGDKKIIARVKKILDMLD